MSKSKNGAAKAPKEEKQKKQSLRELAVLSERTKKADWSVTKEDCIADLRRVQKAEPDAFISRNYYRVNGTYSDSTWNAHFGTFQQFKASAGLQLSRAQSHLEKHIARHAHLDNYREFFETEVAPWVGKYEKPNKSGRFKTLLVASDFHDKEVDEFCLEVFIDTARRVQPDVICLNGDVFDCYEFSSFSIDPREYDIKAHMEFGRDRIFKPLRQVCPDAEIDLTLGNHEHRILRLLADKSPAMKILISLMGITLSQLLGLDDWEINLVTKSDLAAYNAKETLSEVKKNYKKYFDTVVCNHISDDGYGMCTVTGHTHKPRMTTKTTEVMGPIWHITTGGMVKIDQEYHQSKPNAQNSFVIVHIDTETRTACPEHIVFGSHHVVVAGVYYTRKNS